jgi:hypothetical protein
MSSGKFQLEITRSQQMALLDLIMEHLGRKDSTEVFINCSESPEVETTPGELLALISKAHYEPSPEELEAFALAFQQDHRRHS